MKYIEKKFQGTLPENKILNGKSNSQTDTYSCNYLEENLFPIISSASTSGNIKIGNVGIEWGRVEATSNTSPASSTPFTRYAGETVLNFVHTYKNTPVCIAGWAANYNNQIQCWARSITATGCNIGMNILDGGVTRGIRYIVIGELQ